MLYHVQEDDSGEVMRNEFQSCAENWAKLGCVHVLVIKFANELCESKCANFGSILAHCVIL